MVYSNTPQPQVPQGLDAFGAWFNETFRLWSSNWQVYVLQGLIIFAVAVLPSLIGSFISQIAMISATGSSRSEPEAVIGAMLITYSLAGVGGIISLFLMPGMVNTALKQLRGEPTSVGDLFSAPRFAGGYFIVGLVTVLGLIACCVGAYVVSGLLIMALPMMIDRNMSTGEAISLSWETAKRNFWLYVLFTFVLGMIAGAGSIACYIGYIATIAFYPIGSAVAYYYTFYGPVPTMPQGSMANPMPGGVMPPPYTPPPVGEAEKQQLCRWCGGLLDPNNAETCARRAAARKARRSKYFALTGP